MRERKVPADPEQVFILNFDPNLEIKYFTSIDAEIMFLLSRS